MTKTKQSPNCPFLFPPVPSQHFFLPRTELTCSPIDISRVPEVVHHACSTTTHFSPQDLGHRAAYACQTDSVWDWRERPAKEVVGIEHSPQAITIFVGRIVVSYVLSVFMLVKKNVGSSWRACWLILLDERRSFFWCSAQPPSLATTQ
jgi:hypothetical protein